MQGLLSNKNVNIPDPTKIWVKQNLTPPPPWPPGGGFFRFFKVFLSFFFEGLGEILKVTLQTRDWSELSASTSLMSYGDGRQTQ